MKEMIIGSLCGVVLILSLIGPIPYYGGKWYCFWFPEKVTCR